LNGTTDVLAYVTINSGSATTSAIRLVRMTILKKNTLPASIEILLSKKIGRGNTAGQQDWTILNNTG